MSTQLPNTETNTPDYLLGIERGHMVRVPISPSQPNDSQSIATLAAAQVAAGATGVAGVTAGGALVGPSGAALSVAGALGSGHISKLKSSIYAFNQGYRTRPPIILGIGDSNFTGEGAGTGGTANLNNAFAVSPMQQTITALGGTLGGLPVRNTMWFGEGNITANSVAVNAYDPRVTLGTGATIAATANTTGGRFIDLAVGSDFVTFNFGSALTNVEFHYRTDGVSSAAVGIYASDNTLIATANQSPANSVAVTSASSAKFADGIVKIRNDGAAVGNIAGIIAWNSAEKSIIMGQATWSASKAADYAVVTSPWNGSGFLNTIKPEVCIVALTINDINATTAFATYGTSLAVTTSLAAAYGDLIAVTGAPGGGASYTTTLQHYLIQREVLKQAALYDGGFISMHSVFGSYAAANAAGLMFNNIPHMTAAGYAVQATQFAAALRSLV